MVAVAMEKGILGRGDPGAEAWGSRALGCRMSHSVSALGIRTLRRASDCSHYTEEFVSLHPRVLGSQGRGL